MLPTELLSMNQVFFFISLCGQADSVRGCTADIRLLTLPQLSAPLAGA